MSLRLKLVSLTVAAALLPLAASAWTSLSLHQSALERQLTEHHERLAESAAALTEQHLESAMRAFRLAAVPIRWSELSAAEREGALWLVYRQLEDSAITSLLDGRGRGIGPSAYVTGTVEEALAQHPRASLESLRSFAASIPFGEVMERGVAFGQPFPDAEGVAPLVSLGVRVSGARGQSWAVVGALSLRGVCTRLADLRSASVSVYLLDGAGRRLCRPADASGATADRPRTPETALASERSRTFTYTRDHEGVMLATEVALANGWVAVAEVPARVAFALSERMRNQTWLWILVSLAIALGSGLTLAGSLSDRVRTLVRGARELANGNFAHRLPIGGRDELAQLSSQFNHMVEMIERRDVEIRGWNAELTERVVERTRELREAQDQLLHSQKIAAVTTLGAGVAHEINNPLAAVLGLVQLLRTSPDLTDPERQTILSDVEGAARRITKIVQTFLGFSRDIGGGFVSLAPKEAIEGALDLVANELQQQGIGLEQRLDDALPNVLGNKAELQQAFLHIIDNARQAMPGGGALRVSATALDGQVIRLTFEDSGRGIVPEDLPKVFEPFFTTKQGNWRGEGLGLTATYHIIQAHHGKLRVESTPGAGTTVTVHLPAANRGAHLA